MISRNSSSATPSQDGAQRPREAGLGELRAEGPLGPQPRAEAPGAPDRLLRFDQGPRARERPGRLAPRTALRLERIESLARRAVNKARQGPAALAQSAARHASHRARQIWSHARTALIARRAAVQVSARRWNGGPMRCPCAPGLVSIVLPVYNQAEFLAGSIESALNQTYEQFELIIINDGSKDDVGPVLARYVNHPRVRVLTQANQKLPKALSNGFEFARGEFWTWTSADNLMHPEQLSRQVAFLRERPEVSLVYADYLAIDDRGAPLVDPTFRPHNRRDGSPEVHLPRDPRMINVVQDNFIGPCFLYRRPAGRVIGEYDPVLGVEDYDYWMRINHAFGVAHLGIDEPLYQYRVHEQSLSGHAVELKIAERCAALMEHERERARFYRRPWALVLDAVMKDRLAKALPASASVRDLDAAGPRNGPAGGSGPRALADGGKLLQIVDSGTLPRLVAERRADDGPVVAWFDSIEDAYDRWSEALECRAVALTHQEAIAERLDLLGVSAFVVGGPSAVLDLARIHADNRCFFEGARPEALRRRVPPRPFHGANRHHILIQVDHFQEGGLENVALALAEGLRRRGEDVSLLVLGRRGPAAERAREAGVRVLTLPERRREAAYEALLREQCVDLVSAHYSTFGAALAARAAVPFVQIVQNAYVWLDDRAIAEHRAACPHTTAYLCVSAQAARYTDVNLGLAADKIVIVPNGVDARGLDAARDMPPGRLRDELGLAHNDFVFLNVASVHGTKAQKALVRAFAPIAAARPDARLVMVGPAADANYEAEVRRLIERLGLERSVRLTGPRNDAARFYWMADAFVLPSYWEGWSLALTEAVLAGLPAVASDVGSARELLGDSGGWLVQPPFRSISDLNAHTIGPLVHREDEAYIARLSEAMNAARSSPGRSKIDEARRRLLGQDHMVDLHKMIIDWLIQGGIPAAARAWPRLGPEWVAAHMQDPSRHSD